MHFFVIFFLLTNTVFKRCDSSRILGIVPTPSYSHQIPFQPLWKELSLRGHQVTVLTTNPIGDNNLINLTEIDTSFTYKILNDNLLQMINASGNFFKSFELSISTFITLNDKLLEDSRVNRIINNPQEHFDLVITEYIPPMFAFGKRLKCPIITFTCSEPPIGILRWLGNPVHPIVYPEVFLNVSNTSLIERVIIILYEALLRWYIEWTAVSSIDSIVSKHFGKSYTMSELKQYISLLFLYTNPVVNQVRPLIPTIVEIAGHVERITVKPMDEKLETTLDSATNGFIYFSLGTNVKSTDISAETLHTILETFRELPYIILWKYEVDSLDNKPENVIIAPWLPQQGVLHHHNIKLFITHGGGMSIEEAVYAKVPMLGMPYFVDQPRNIQRMVSKGVALSIDHKTLNKNELKATILELINNPKYKKRVQETSEWSTNEPMTGLEKAVWWTEYVIRHNGTKHLKSPILDIPWYQYMLLDVYGVILLILIVILFFVILSFKLVLQICKKCILSNIKMKQY